MRIDLSRRRFVLLICCRTACRTSYSLAVIVCLKWAREYVARVKLMGTKPKVAIADPSINTNIP